MDERREERDELEAIQREDEDDARDDAKRVHDEWCFIACPHETPPSR